MHLASYPILVRGRCPVTCYKCVLLFMDGSRITTRRLSPDVPQSLEDECVMLHRSSAISTAHPRYRGFCCMSPTVAFSSDVLSTSVPLYIYIALVLFPFLLYYIQGRRQQKSAKYTSPFPTLWYCYLGTSVQDARSFK